MRSAIVRLLPLTIALALAANTLAQDQPHPDLSGTWRLNLTKSKLAKGDATQRETLVITASGLSVTMRFDSDGKQTTRTYVIDGKEHPYAAVRNGENLTKAYWRKSALIIEDFARLKMPDAAAANGSELWRVKEQWTLSSDGRVLTEQAEGFDSKTVNIYDRQ